MILVDLAIRISATVLTAARMNLCAPSCLRTPNLDGLRRRLANQSVLVYFALVATVPAGNYRSVR